MISLEGKIPVRIHPIFWMLILILGWINSHSILGTAIWAVVIFFSVLIHEYGHALTAIAFGQKARIDLIGLGGVTSREGPKLPLWKEFIIVLNGPLAGFLLFCGAYLIFMMQGEDKPTSIWTYGLYITIYANLFWTILNLLPIYPLDGGKLLSIILESIFGVRGIQSALLISCILAVLASVGFFLVQAFLGGAIFLLFAYESYKAWQSSLALSNDVNHDEYALLFIQAQEDARTGQKDEAHRKLEEIRNATKRGKLFIAATEGLASIAYSQGNFHEVFDLLHPIKNEISPEAFKMLHRAAFKNKQWREVVSLGNQIYQLYPEYEVAFINALSHARLGEAQPAIGWMQRAISDGLPDISVALRREDFNEIRLSPAFQEFSHRYI